MSREHRDRRAWPHPTADTPTHDATAEPAGPAGLLAGKGVTGMGGMGGMPGRGRLPRGAGRDRGAGDRQGEHYDALVTLADGVVAQVVDILADSPGAWMLHRHNAFHMGAGMMTRLDYTT